MGLENLKFADILYNSPFDSQRNKNNLITPEIFFKEIFFPSENFLKQENNLIQIINSSIEENRIVLIDGYSGIGKTTFIHNFIRNHKEFTSIPIDFHEFPITQNNNGIKSTHRDPDNSYIIIELLEQIERNPQKTKEISTRIKEMLVNKDEIVNPILSVIKSFIQKEFFNTQRQDNIDIFVEFLFKHLKDFSPHLSNLFILNIELYNTPKKFNDSLHYILRDCNFNDSFFIFFLFCFLNLDPIQIKLFFFDNLDAVNIDYLSDYFRNNFKRVLSNITFFAQEFFPEINFSSTYKFIFCLRDGNGAIVNSHLLGSFLGYKKELNFRINYDPEIYSNIIKRRVDYFYKINNGKVEENIEGIVKLLEAFSTDKYFRQVIIPLFNADIRKINYYLFQVSQNNLLISLDKNQPKIYDLAKADAVGKFGLRGTLLFGILKLLRSQDFLKTYPFFREATYETSNGHISHLRIILIVLINLSGITKSSYVDDASFRPKDIDLVTLFRSLKLLFTEKEILNTLIEAFKLHSQNWVNLITFRNIPFNSNEKIEDFLNTNIEDYNIETYAEYQKTSVNINPSGFVYVKYILTHFEFYAVVCGLNNSLFSLGLETNESGNYLFQENLIKVYNLVKQHITQIQAYFYQVFETKYKWTRKKFRSSIFTFKHFGEETPSSVGMSHTTRILTSMIPYLDNFRFSVLIIADKKGDLRLKQRINRNMVTEIERYNELFLLINEEAARKTFYLGFKEKIDTIKSSDFTDFKTDISTIGSQMYFDEHIKEQHDMKEEGL